MVFLNTSSGDRFLGSTGRYLSSPGSSRAYAMFSQFRPFGQTVGELDLSKVASISIGWGGYLGTEGEQIATVHLVSKYTMEPKLFLPKWTVGLEFSLLALKIQVEGSTLLTSASDSFTGQAGIRFQF
ncbi:MAG: hypothetical protein MUC95_03245 [Spirochaetes bacterium]|nr:hypothetical protein [Spirochaetota bacterium]